MRAINGDSGGTAHFSLSSALDCQPIVGRYLENCSRTCRPIHINLLLVLVRELTPEVCADILRTFCIIHVRNFSHNLVCLYAADTVVTLVLTLQRCLPCASSHCVT
jgi:hypothetical protein